MKGQRWEPCPLCDREPVCNNCGVCSAHCECDKAASPQPGRNDIGHPGVWVADIQMYKRFKSETEEREFFDNT